MKGVMVTRCVGIIRRSGLRCRSFSNDDGDRCGRHGGVSRSQSRRLQISEDDAVKDIVDDMKSLQINKPFISGPVKSFSCIICLDDDLNVDKDGYTLSCCKQAVCGVCIQRWVSVSLSCPYCRTKCNVVL